MVGAVASLVESCAVGEINVFGRILFEIRSSVEATRAEECSHRHVTAGGFDDAHSSYVQTEPFSDDFDVFGSDEIGPIGHDEVCETDPAEPHHVELVVIAVAGGAFTIGEADDAIDVEQPPIPLIERCPGDP